MAYSPTGDAPFSRQVYHEAYIEVDEAGTEAAGATAGAGTRQLQPWARRLEADHPFLFTVTDRPTGAVLFVGRVVNPGEAGAGGGRGRGDRGPVDQGLP